MMRIGLTADHSGFALKRQLSKAFRQAGYEMIDFGANQPTPDDDYPDYVVPLGRAVAQQEVEQRIAIWGQRRQIHGGADRSRHRQYRAPGNAGCLPGPRPTARHSRRVIRIHLTGDIRRGLTALEQAITASLEEAAAVALVEALA